MRLDEWQRLSLWAVLLLLMQGVVKQARQHMPLLLGAGAGVAYAERIGLVEIVLGGVALLCLAASISVLYYRRFRFRLDGDVLVVQKGLFEHREFKAASDHVQHIAVQQPLYMRPFGVVLWRLETTAGEASGIELPGIRRCVADALGQRLASQPLASVPEHERFETQDTVTTSRVCYAATPWGVTLHGLASRSILVVAAMLSPLVRPLERWAHDTLPRTEALQALLASPVLAAGLGIALLVVMLMCLGVAASWWRFHGYVLRDEGERYVQVSGLLQRQEQALSLRRLQVVEWVQTGFGRLLGRGYLVCRQFGALKGSGAEEARQFLVPGLKPATGLGLARELWPGLQAPERLLRVSPVYRRVLFVRTLLVLSSGLLLLTWLTGAARTSLSALEQSLPVAAVIGLAMVFAQLRWKTLGWSRQGNYLWVRRGLVGQRTSLFPLDNVISLEVQQSWLQRRRGLATLHLHLANGRQTLPFLKQSEAMALANLLLACLETMPRRTGPAGKPPECAR